MEDKRFDSFASSEWTPTPNLITLQAGKKYYLEVLHSEGGGGDNVGVTYKLDSEDDPATSAAPKLTGSVMGVYLNPNGASVNFTQQPQSLTVGENLPATFTALATGVSAYGTNVTYQWQKAAKGSTSFADVAGASQRFLHHPGPAAVRGWQPISRGGFGPDRERQ